MVAQREIGVDTESFSTGMRSAMREAPNVILVGEIRDTESMEYALKFANTGHLWPEHPALEQFGLGDRAHDQLFCHRELQPGTAAHRRQTCGRLSCQRLVPTLDGKKTAATEVLINTPRVKDLIERHEFGDIHEAIKAGHSYGMHTFDQSLIALYEAGTISADVAVEFADSRNNVSLHIRVNRSGDDGGMDDMQLEKI